jgi:hypothetical protein
LTLDSMKAYAEHSLAFGAEALDDLDQVGSALNAYHRPAAIRGAVQERLGFAYRAEAVEPKARRAFLDASESWGAAEQLLATNPGDNAGSVTETALADERERQRVRRLKCALLSGDMVAGALASEELRDQPPSAAADARTLYAIACLYSCAAERVEAAKYLPLAWNYLGRALLAATEDLIWDQARADPELAYLTDRQRFVDDLNHTWAIRRRKKSPPLLATEVESLVLAAVKRLSAA